MISIGKVTTDQVQRILSGNHSFSMLGFSLLIARQRNIYTYNSSESTLIQCADEINDFIEKFGAIMSEDLETLKKI